MYNMPPRKHTGELPRPVEDNVVHADMKKHRAGKHPQGAVSRIEKGLSHKQPGKHELLKSGPVHVAKHEGPQASSLPGMMGIIDPMSAGRPQHPGIPGLVNSTTMGPEVRQRLVSGIIESTMGGGRAPEGPVHKVAGHDATAYNAGMRHIPGSPF